MKIYESSSTVIKNWQWGHPGLINLTMHVLGLVRDNSGAALDVGCGTGRLSLALATLGFTVDGVDPEAKVVHIAQSMARDSNADVQFFTEDFSRPLDWLGGKQYDLVVCTEVLEHVASYKSIVENIYSVLKPGGQFIVSVPHDPRQFSLLDSHGGHLRRFTIPEVKSLLHEFVIDDCFTIGFPFMRLMVAVRAAYLTRAHKIPTYQHEWNTPGATRFIPWLAGRLTLIDNLFNRWNRGTNIVCSATKKVKHAS